jgi:hypothetical protein
MNYRNAHRRTRDRIIEAEIRKLELRRAQDARLQRELQRLREDAQPRSQAR